ncbi:MAG TPA: hypothetical protein VNU70_01225 [Puia sp.]|nr:hypothetical protein [Puia sp.]
MALHHPLQVIGFHGCDREVGLRMLTGKDHLRLSDNDWDWLGLGAYFWEDDPYRALSYAIGCAQKKQKFSGEIRNPLVIGSIIELGNCLNLVEANSCEIIRKAYEFLKSQMKQNGKEMPSNRGANRALDCAVIRALHEVNKMYGFPPYDTIRSPFHQGEPLYEGANFTTGLHMQICVLNTAMIKGYFLPQPLEKFNPWLNKDFDPDMH